MEVNVIEPLYDSNKVFGSNAENVANFHSSILIYILQLYSDQLHKGTKDKLAASTSPVWPSWVFAESPRRTILESHLLWGLYAYIKIGFLKSFAPFVPLTFAARAPQMGQTSGRDISIAMVSHCDYV